MPASCATLQAQPSFLHSLPTPVLGQLRRFVASGKGVPAGRGGAAAAEGKDGGGGGAQATAAADAPAGAAGARGRDAAAKLAALLDAAAASKVGDGAGAVGDGQQAKRKRGAAHGELRTPAAGSGQAEARNVQRYEQQLRQYIGTKQFTARAAASAAPISGTSGRDAAVLLCRK